MADRSRAVLPRYFRTMGISMRAGRDFTAADTAASPKVAIVNRALADRHFPGGRAIGRLIHVNSDETFPREIVGVVDDVNSRSLRDETGGQVYVPLTQSPWRDMTLVVRTAGEPGAMVPAIRQALREVDGTQPPYDIRTMADVLGRATMTERLSAALTAAFGVIALLLTTVGIYGVMAFSVSRRRREMGLRLALGADPGRVRRLVVAEGARLVVVGLAVGLAAALLTGRFLATSLYRLTPSDPVTLAAVAALVLLTAGLATLVPAARAARVDPLSCLRSD
jgi:putative ABC transport system permease protein